VYRPGNKDKAVASSADDARRHPFYKQWSEDQVTRAVVTSGMSVRLAALQFNVPKSTLGDRTNGRVQCRWSCKWPCYIFDSCIREQICEVLVSLFSNWICRSSKGMGITVTRGWWNSFRKRDPEIVLRAPVMQGAQLLIQKMFMRHFDLLEETIKENKLSGKP